MKNLRFVLCAFVVLLMASSAFAQTNVTANVPFDFVVGNHYYPAGEYSLKTISDSGVMQITNTDVNARVLTGSLPCSSGLAADKTVLQFRRMGNLYFLNRIWVEGQITGREFPRSHEERRLAQLREKPESVIVAANIAK
jgi:hypothetical protein